MEFRLRSREKIEKIEKDGGEFVFVSKLTRELIGNSNSFSLETQQPCLFDSKHISLSLLYLLFEEGWREKAIRI